MKSKNSPSNKLENKIRHLTGKAIFDFNMIEEGDKIVCGLSGGKDSFVMLDTLLHLKRVAPIKFDVIAVNLDQKQPGFPEHILPNYLEEKGIDYYIIDKDTYSVVKQKYLRVKQRVLCVQDSEEVHYMVSLKQLVQLKLR